MQKISAGCRGVGQAADDYDSAVDPADRLRAFANAARMIAAYKRADRNGVLSRTPAQLICNLIAVGSEGPHVAAYRTAFGL